MSYTVYMICDPDGAPRYVGLTTQPLATRLGGHRSDGLRVAKWIRGLPAGTEPTIEALQTLPGITKMTAALIVEHAWIARLLDDGADLLNEDVKRCEQW